MDNMEESTYKSDVDTKNDPKEKTKKENEQGITEKTNENGIIEQIIDFNCADPICARCPHCNGEIWIFKKEINCGIFRHATYKDGKQVNPHAPKAVCDKLVADDKVLGCCKPFELIKRNNKYVLRECEYK